MVVLRIKEYDDGEICLEYRMTRKERGMTISNRKVDIVSYHYFKLGTFREGSSIIDPIDNDASFDLIKTLSEVGEKHITDFTIELAVNYDERFWIASAIRLFRLTPEDVLLVRHNFD